VSDDVIAYMIERFRAWYEEAGIAAEIFQAVGAKQLTVPLDINNRVYAVAAFSKLPEATALAAANKRVSNILAKLEGAAPTAVNEGLLSDAAEVKLANSLADIKKQVEPKLAARDYTAFDDVMVMTDDEAVRNNRLALLNQLRETFLATADISLLVVK